MQVFGVSEFRSNLAATLDHAHDVHSPVFIKSGQNTSVLISLDDYNAHMETVYLSSKANATRLLKSIESANKAEVLNKELIDA